MEDKQDFFDKFGLEVQAGEVEVGQTYPIYGMITSLTTQEDGKIVAEINFTIKANMMINDSSKVELLRLRAFEPGIFVSTVTSKDPCVVVNCSTVVFGKSQNYLASQN
jgi:hypothetical protein